MKEKILENYGYKIKYLFYRRKIVSFLYDNQYYIIQNVDVDELSIQKLSYIVAFLEQYNLFFHEIMMTKNGNYIFEHNNKKYVVMHARIILDREVCDEEMIALMSINIDGLQIEKISPEIKIANKIDALEKFIANYEKKYIDSLENFNYFIGLAESSIALYSSIDYKKIPFALVHKRFNKNIKAIYFFNPFELTIDFRTRDIAEYVKCLFFNEDKDMISYYLKYVNYNEYTAFFARLLYPSYYFDAVDSLIANDISNYDLKIIKTRAKSYENAIKKTYFAMQKYANLPYIEWLSNIDNF